MATLSTRLRVSFRQQPRSWQAAGIAFGVCGLGLLSVWGMSLWRAQAARQATEAAFRLADRAQQQGNSQEAVHRLRALLERYPDNARARLRLGKTLFDMGDRLGARRHLVAAAKALPDDPAAWNLAGRACKAVNDYGAAEDAFLHAARLQPRNARNLTDLAGVQAVNHKLDEAEAAYRRALGVNASDSNTLFTLAGFLQDYRAGAEQRAEARKLLKAALRVDNTNRDAWFRLGTLEMERGKLDNAVVYLKIAVEQAADKWNGWFALAQAYQRMGDRPHAEQALARYRAIRDQFAELKILRERLSQTPNDAGLHRELARLYEKRGERDGAASERNTASQLEALKARVPSVPALPASVAPPTPANAPAVSTPTHPLFTDVASTSGLNYRWQIAGNRPLTILQTIGNGCAFLDYNRDGNLDILLVGPKVALFQGDGKGHFTDVSVQTGIASLKGDFRGVAVGDVDNDGYVDVYLSGYRTGILLHNEGGLTPRPPSLTTRSSLGKGENRERHTLPLPGEPASEFGKGVGGLGRHFRDVTKSVGLKPQPWGTSCLFTDVDGDGKLDLYIGNYVQFDARTTPQLCGFHGHQSACAPLVYKPVRGVLYRNEGGKFRDVTKAWGADKAAGNTLGVACADFDGSGRQSLAVANDSRAGDLFHNMGHRFENIGEAAGIATSRSGDFIGGMGIDWGDYNNDGKLDLVVAAFERQAKCLYHNQGRYFTEESAQSGLADALPYVAFGVKWLDFDNDGWLDLIFANGHVQDNIAEMDKNAAYRQPTLLFRNQGGTQFVNVSGQMQAGAQRALVGRGLAIGDYDNDGKMDVLIVDSEGAPLLLHNESQARNHWLGLRLQQPHAYGNGDAYGAIVSVKTPAQTLLRQCQPGGSYLSSSDARVHFGLGSARTVTSVAVCWPNGERETWKNLPADRYVTLTHGKGGK